jgi:branched-chain amino acid transport system permease protein
VAAVVLGLIRSFGTIGFPLFTDGLSYVVMIAILITRPAGLFGREVV